jgi:hypothetical protein
MRYGERENSIEAQRLARCADIGGVFMVLRGEASIYLSIKMEVLTKPPRSGSINPAIPSRPAEGQAL